MSKPTREDRPAHRRGMRHFGQHHARARGDEHHRWQHGRHPRRLWILRHRLHWRLFWWFGATIVATGLAVGLTFSTLLPGIEWRQDIATLREFLVQELVENWDKPVRRRELLQGVQSALHLQLSLRDAQGNLLEPGAESCRHEHFKLPLRRADQYLGTLTGCWQHPERAGSFLLGLGVACMTLWGASFLLARRISRPWTDLVRVTREIGAGQLSSRVGLHCEREGEVGVLAEAINEMAARIEKQIKDQRELLATVSHEIRSPLARLRVLAELAAQAPGQPERFADIEREILEIDALVGKLLASSRIEFGALQRQRLDARQVALQALQRASLPVELLPAVHTGTENLVLRADPTLLGRALGNLLENAARHAGGVESLLVSAQDELVIFEVNDRGPGFPEASLARVFEAFYTNAPAPDALGAPSRAAPTHASLGLGLALVQRIARAHGGSASARNRSEGGASVRLELPRDESPDESSDSTPT